MSIERIWRWTCNPCGEEALRMRFGLPHGWVIFHYDGETLHACPTCAPEVPEAKLPTEYGGRYCEDDQ